MKTMIRNMSSKAMDLSIRWPFKWCLVGSSGSGKTNFSLEIIRHAQRLFDKVPSKIMIFREKSQNYQNFQTLSFTSNFGRNWMSTTKKLCFSQFFQLCVSFSNSAQTSMF